MIKRIDYDPSNIQRLTLSDGDTYELTYELTYEHEFTHHGQKFKRKLVATLERDGNEIKFTSPDKPLRSGLKPNSVFTGNHFVEVGIMGDFTFVKSGGGLTAKTSSDDGLAVMVGFLDFESHSLSAKNYTPEAVNPPNQTVLENGMHLLHKERMKVEIKPGHDIRIYTGYKGLRAKALISYSPENDIVRIQSLINGGFGDQKLQNGRTSPLLIDEHLFRVRFEEDHLSLELIESFQEYFWLDVSEHEPIGDQDTWDEDEPTEETAPPGTTLPGNQ